jgi:S1-C subfamily serine protease
MIRFLAEAKSRACVVILGLLACATSLHAQPTVMTADTGGQERAVVQILTSSREPLYDAPWRFEPVQRSSGTGFVIAGKRIMTNAHVIAWAKQILVRRYQDPQLLPARVVYVGHDCDLALLELEDGTALDGITPLAFGELPPVRSSVVTCGYPAGGEQIAFTRGVVSRIELQTYAHAGNRALLAVQTDAAINPGNSGGPVLQDGRVVGVAFQGIPSLQNAGFFIPPEVITHFLADVSDNHYDGFPLAGISFYPLQNPAYRKHLGLPDDGRGARIDRLRDDAPAAALLRPDDVLLEVDGLAVGSDGAVLYRGNRVSVAVAFQRPQTGGTVRVKLWRDLAELTVDVPVVSYVGDRLTGLQYDTLPRYLVYGGLVFTPLSADYLDTVGRVGRDAIWSRLSTLTYELYHHRLENPETARAEPIVLATILPHAVNADFGVRRQALVDEINGIRIECLEDVRRALDRQTGPRHTFTFDGYGDGLIEALDRPAADAAQPTILSTYGLTTAQRL